MPGYETLYGYLGQIMSVISVASPANSDRDDVTVVPWYTTPIGRIFLTVSVLIGLLSAWWGYVLLMGLSPLVLPTPYAVWQSLVENTLNGVLPLHTLTTFTEIMLGFLVGSALGIALGVITAQSQLMRAILNPYILASQAMPKLALAPIMVVWLGFGIAPKVVITALICFFPLLENTIIGLTSADPYHLELFRALTAKGWQTFLKLRIPNALPVIFAGLRVAITLAVVGAVVGEYVGANRGLGALVIVTQGDFDTPLMFAVFVYLTVIGIALYKIMEFFERTCFAWRYIKRGD
jgi:NitT/TauT family transport system permease protein